MSNVKLAGNVSGTGSVTIASPNTNSDFTIALPASNGTMMTTDTSISASQIPDGSITTAKIADSNVTTAKIADLNVTTAKIAANAVTAAKLAREGSSGQVLTSNGAGSDPSYQSLPAGGVTSLNGQTGAITNTSQYAIGSSIIGRPKNNTTYASNSTIAGSSLWGVSAGTRWNGTDFVLLNSGTTATGELVNTGTWRCMSIAEYNGTYGAAFPGLWTRIS